MPFMAKAIPPKLLKTAAVRGQVLSTLQLTKKEVQFALELTTATWQHPVNFEAHIQYRGGNLIVACWTMDYVWNLLEVGTARRFATMTPGFQAKTRPGMLGSFRGSGGLAFVNRNRPRPGIKAREWSQALYRTYGKTFSQRVVAAVYRGFS